MFLLTLMMVSLLAFNENQVEGCTAGLLEYCNLNASLDNNIPCQPPFICNEHYRQCLKPDDSPCTSNWECLNTCYNGTCLSPEQYQQFACNDSSQCDSPYICSTTTKDCRLPPGAECNAAAICANATACINGNCSAPDLYNVCDRNSQNYPCRRGQCDPDFGVCLIPEGGDCTESPECGTPTGRICFQGKCQRPSLNQICQPTASNGIPATICREGVCSGTTGYCVPAPPQIEGNAAGLLEYCNLNASVDNILPCKPSLICNEHSKQCLKPDNSPCTSNWECLNTCYNGTCLSPEQYQKFACENSSQCSSPYICSDTTKDCRLPPAAACNAAAICANATACINGFCSAPDLYNVCDLNCQTYSCRRGECDPDLRVCLIPEGGNCTKSPECGTPTGRICFQGKCQRPGLNQRCQATASDGIPATKCREGVCSSTTGYCVRSGGIMMKASTLLMIPLSIVYFLMTRQ